MMSRLAVIGGDPSHAMRMALASAAPGAVVVNDGRMRREAIGLQPWQRAVANELLSEKPWKDCLRPGCLMQTQHNGGYCSAKCCRLHREERQGKKS